MPGFIFVKGSLKNDFLDYKNEKLLVENLEYDDIKIQRRTIKKFLDDKIFYQNENYLIVTEGVIFNKFELIKKYQKENFKDTIIEMYKKNGDTFFNEFRGSFSGIFIDKKENNSLIYVDQIGSRPLYYYSEDNNIIISSRMEEIVKISNKKFSLNEVGCYCILTHGFMIDKMTLVKEIERILPGKFIKIFNNNFEIKRYHLLNNKANYEQTEEEIIDEIDFLFKKAVELEVNKNKEYGYEDLAPLSAGLDSRMTVMELINSNETTNLLTFTYSESNYYDENIPKKIADDFKLHWIFKNLDNGLNLFYLDEVTKLNEGNCLYAGGAQVLDTFQILNLEKKGIIHTGMIGDVVVGTFYEQKEEKINYDIKSGAYSNTLISKLKEKLKTFPIENYRNEEIFKFYTRGFLGANMGSPCIFISELESFSPFYNLDFLEYCLTIPLEKRWNYYIYDKWVITKYPKATKYLHNGKRRVGEKNISFLGRNISKTKLFIKIYNIILKFLRQNQERKNMNPVDYWYENNKELKEFLDNYYLENIKNSIITKELYNDIKFLYENGTGIEKIQVVSLLAGIKFNFKKD